MIAAVLVYIPTTHNGKMFYLNVTVLKDSNY